MKKKLWGKIFMLSFFILLGGRFLLGVVFDVLAVLTNGLQIISDIRVYVDLTLNIAFYLCFALTPLGLIIYLFGIREIQKNADKKEPL